MADISVTAANVKPGTGCVINRGIAGATITAGESLEVDPSAGTLKPAKADTLADAATVGIALNGGASGQPINYASGGSINPGGTLTVGEVYIVSPNNAGGIAPYGDIGSTNYMTVLGIATTASNLLLNIWEPGVAHA